jgi:hypothetical protein
VGDAEVDDDRVTAREQDVSGLDVAMDDAVLVRVRERVGDVARDRDRVGNRQLLLARDALAQRLALHEGEHMIEQAARFARVEQREDVRMLERGLDAQLAEEPVGPYRCGELGMKDLERHAALVLDVASEVDGRGATASELSFQLVASGESRPYARIIVRDGR